MAPPKPSQQSRLIMDAFEEGRCKDDDRWEKVMDSLDLLFARVEDVNNAQTQLQANQDLTTRAMDQIMNDQSFLTKQVEETGREVAQLRMDRMWDDKFDAGAAAAIDFRGRDFELLPFGSGRRMCPGMPLALRMVHLMLASLLHHFEWRLLPADDKNGLDMAERVGLNLSMATPLQVMATPHQFK